MRTEIFNPGVLINRTISKIRGSRKRSGWRSMMLWLLLLIAALTGCTDGAINAYMDYEPNRAPQILELQSDFGGLPVPGDIMTINCRVYDPDGNPLTYTFTSGQGSFTDQRDTAGGSEITFVVGNISGGEEVNVSVTVTDSKKASVAASLNIGTSSLGPVITLVKPMNTTIGADGYSPVTFRSSMKGYYQVGLAGDGIPADEFNPAKPLFIVQKNSDTLFTICGSLYSDDKYMEGIPRVPNGTGNRVIIKVMDGMGQISVHEILFDVIGATPVVANPEIRITDLTENSMTLNWNPATDPDNPAGEPYKGIEYRVYMSAKDNISTLEDTDSHGRVVLDWAEDLNFFQVEGLTPSTAYYFNVVVRDGDGVKEIYDVVEGRTKESIAGLSMLRYDGNGATGGVVPDYARYFKEGESVTVSGNTGNFINPDYTFSGWNTAPDGSGTSFSEGDSLTIGSEDIVLYALWRRGFVTTWKTDNPGASGDNQITIPVYDGEIYDYTVEWGDGSRDTHLTGSASHTYDDIGIYTVTIIGTFPRIFFNNSGDREKILTIEQWGEIEWTSMARAFFGCNNLTCNAIDAPDLSGVTDMSFIFTYATSFNGDISGWDVSNVRNMFKVFQDATSFNGDISNWDVSSVTNMSLIFYGAISFNGDICGWDVSNVTNMSYMFSNAIYFNGDVSGWDVSSVTNMYQMFLNTPSFSNHDLSSWDIINVTNHKEFSTGWGEGNTEPVWP